MLGHRAGKSRSFEKRPVKEKIRRQKSPQKAAIWQVGSYRPSWQFGKGYLKIPLAELPMI